MIHHSKSGGFNHSSIHRVMKTKPNFHSEFKKISQDKLRSAIILDVIGAASTLFLFFGEATDIIYAPIYMMAVYGLFKVHGGFAKTAAFGGFVKEILPGTDIIPLASLLWLFFYRYREEKTFRKFVDNYYDQEDYIQQRAEQSHRPGLLGQIIAKLRELFGLNSHQPPTKVNYDDYGDGFEGAVTVEPDEPRPIDSESYDTVLSEESEKKEREFASAYDSSWRQS